MVYIRSLSLHAFRNYAAAAIDGLEHGFVVLTGANGAGKTNCLEAISLLSPGRGLRGAAVADCQSADHPQTLWTVSAALIDKDGDEGRLGVGRDPQKPDKKIIRYNGNPVRNQEELGDILRCVWLTPQMDGLFLQGGTERRRFFDRLVAAFDPAHAGRMTRYEKAMRERLNLLKDSQDKNVKPDGVWLEALEQIMAETAVAIAATRLDGLEQLQNALDHNRSEDFPGAIMALDGELETALGRQTALQVEEICRTRLARFRQSDAITGRSGYGIHRTDWTVFHKDKNMTAAQSSTGEQKALLAAIIMAHAHLVSSRYGAPPVLLFDEIAAHFDAARRDALFDILNGLGGQIWVTGQDRKSFESLPSPCLVSVYGNSLGKL